MNIYILLTSVGSDAGPFNIYSDVDGYLSAFATNVSSATLESGYPAIAPDGTIVVRLRSIGECTNYLDVVVGGGPIPTTTTTTTNQYSNYWYYGRYNSPGGIVPIPTELDINILSGSVVTVLPPLGVFNIPFNSVNDDFLWFAIPTSVGAKSTWFVNSLNQGLIGGPANNFGNLFPDPVVVVYNTISYNLYISTGRTDVVQMTISGSVAPALILKFNNIINANSLVGNASDVNDWNTFFNLPTYGNLFTSVQISGNYVSLFGGSNIIAYIDLFRNNNDLISVNDQLACIVECESNVFEYCDQLLSVNLPGVTTVADDIFRYCDYLVTANLPALITAGNDLFEYCTDLTTVNLPLLTTVSFSTFHDCPNLVNVSLPSLVTSGSGLFEFCTDLTTVNLPQLITLGDSGFSDCVSLVNISLPSLTTLGSLCFQNCTSLTTISLPACTNLGGTVGDDSVFFGILGNTISLTVPIALMTVNSGNPDGDIQYLQANNTVTIITV